MLTYTKTKWVDDVTDVDAEKLNNIEDQIEKLTTCCNLLNNLIESKIWLKDLIGANIKVTVNGKQMPLDTFLKTFSPNNDPKKPSHEIALCGEVLCGETYCGGDPS